MCKNGLGQKKTLPVQLRYFKASAELENKNAMCEYALELLEGENVPQDVDKGFLCCKNHWAW